MSALVDNGHEQECLGKSILFLKENAFDTAYIHNETMLERQGIMSKNCFPNEYVIILIVNQ